MNNAWLAAVGILVIFAVGVTSVKLIENGLYWYGAILAIAGTSIVLAPIVYTALNADETTRR